MPRSLDALGSPQDKFHSGGSHRDSADRSGAGARQTNTQLRSIGKGWGTTALASMATSRTGHEKLSPSLRDELIAGPSCTAVITCAG